MKRIIIIWICFGMLFSSCMKQLERDLTPSINPNPSVNPKAILVDASRDGGVWWFPQGGTYDPSQVHQGSQLANYLRGLGYKVDELGRGTTVTKEILQQYKYVIRAVAVGGYSSAELEAYQHFLQGKNVLLLINDHMGNTNNDNLSAMLGLNFQGAYNGPITPVGGHPITAGVTSLNYIAGSVILKPDANKLTVLGYYNNSTVKNAAAMGIVIHPTCRIFFLGDLNGIEQVPQPFTANLFTWLLQ